MKKFVLIGIFVLIAIVILNLGENKDKKEPGTTGQNQKPVITTIQNTKPVCKFSGKIGYRIVILNGVKTAVWYPTLSKETIYDYSKDFSTNLAVDAQPIGDCGSFPLVVFSHGFGGCGTQTIFFTEALAREGYIVVAPDHGDALCSVDNKSGNFADLSKEPSLFDPAKWSEASYISRRDDIKKVIDGVLDHSDFRNVTNKDKIAIAGHSLGGYVALGLAGGWESWRDNRVKAILLFSPYSLAFSLNSRLSAVNVPVMYQGADFDLGITPFLEGKDGAYEKSNKPKYFVKFRAGNHFIWTVLECLGRKMTSECLKSDPIAKTINDYGIGFLNKYLKGKNSSVLTGKGAVLSDYKFQE